MRLVSGKKLYSFGQFLPSGGNLSLGYVAMTPETFSKPKDSEEEAHRSLTRFPWEKFTGDVPVLSVGEFEKKVKGSLEFVTDLRQKLAEGRLDKEERKGILDRRADVLMREWAKDDHILELLEDDSKKIKASQKGDKQTGSTK